MKQRLRESRVAATQRLCEALVALPSPPRVLVCASATGFYGHRGAAWLYETSASGTGFLAELTREWEAAAAVAARAGLRVVHLRFGLLDLIMLGFPLPGQPSTLLFRNEGGGVFTVLTNGLPQLDDGVVRWGDYNGDGLLDLLIAGGQQSLILKGHGDGTFSDIHAPLTIRSRLTAAWVDIDGDGDLDVHLESGLFRNDGHDVFTRVVTSFENLSTVGFAWGDFDNDGDLDVITSFPTANGLPVSAEHVRLFLNLGSGTFMDGGGGFPAAQTFVTAGDLNQDGYLDVVVGGFDGSGGNAVVYTNTQRRTFAPVPGGALAGVPKGMAVLGDYDNDGFLDVLVSQSSWTGATMAHLYRNNRNGTYSTLDFPLVGGESGNPTWADYDNDGRLDLLLPSAFPLLLHNNMPVRNVAPAPPSGLRAAVGPTGEVRLEWDPANDGATPASLRYNLRVGTRPGTEDVMAASADPVTGHRRLADFGNAGTTRFWRLRLPAGSYYWSVQAIDAGMAGSPFAAESSFTITAPGFTRIAVLPGGARRLSFTNAPGSLCLISASTNLALSRWLPLGPASETSPGSFEFIDPQPMSSHRFYRVQSP